MTGAQSDAAECSADDNGDDQDAACDAELVINHDLLFVDGTFGCETTRNVTVTCTWDANPATGFGATRSGNFTDAEAIIGAKCEVEVN